MLIQTALRLMGAALLSCGLVTGSIASTPGTAMQVIFIDVEGGQATLFVTPRHESLLIDTGWPGNQGRDADRIVQAAKRAGLKQLDYVLITHYHDDHVGGAAALAARIPVRTFIDHGPNREWGDSKTEAGWTAYQTLFGGATRRLIVKPGDTLPLQGLNATIVSSDGQVIGMPIGSVATQNPECAGSPRLAPDTTENGRSLGVLVRFGGLRILDLGDLTADKEKDLLCPRNLLGKIDVLIVSHHGFDQSSSPLLIHSIEPRVAIMDNGARKGGSPAVIDLIQASPGLQTLWQLHYSEEGGNAHNTAEQFMANLRGADRGHYLLLTVRPDGSFDVFNSRSAVSTAYAQPLRPRE